MERPSRTLHHGHRRQIETDPTIKPIACLSCPNQALDDTPGGGRAVPRPSRSRGPGHGCCARPSCRNGRTASSNTPTGRMPALFSRIDTTSDSKISVKPVTSPEDHPATVVRPDPASSRTVSPIQGYAGAPARRIASRQRSPDPGLSVSKAQGGSTAHLEMVDLSAALPAEEQYIIHFF